MLCQLVWLLVLLWSYTTNKFHKLELSIQSKYLLFFLKC